MLATLRRLSGTAVLAVAVLAVSGGTATAQSTGWQLTLQIPTAPPIENSQFTDVAVIDADSAWAVGDEEIDSDGGPQDSSVIERWDGTSWRQVAGPTPPASAVDAQLTTVYAPADDDVWVAGFADYSPSSNQGSFVAHWDGASWTTHDLGVNWAVRHIAVFAPNNVWVLGTSGRSRSVSAHWDGTTWTSGRLPARPDQGSEYDSTSPAWAVAHDLATGAPQLLHYDGTRWVLAPAPAVPLPAGALGVDFSDVLQLGPTDMWLTVGYNGDESLAPGLGLWHWDGTSWTHTLELRNESPEGITTDGGSGLWLLSAGVRSSPRLLHVIGRRVVAKVSAPRPAGGTLVLNSIADADSAGAVWAVGAIVTKGDSSAVIERYQP